MQDREMDVLTPYDIANHFPAILPKHACGLYLQHNPHKDVYTKLESWLKDYDPEMYEFASDDARQRCIDTDEIWTLQWYPNTPVGFNAVAGSTLNECLELAVLYA